MRENVYHICHNTQYLLLIDYDNYMEYFIWITIGNFVLISTEYFSQVF